jgi:iron-sulfur cluster assembly accessory protein
MTAVIQNDPVVNLTPSAQEQVRELCAQGGRHAGQHLRVYVESGGCSGMQYGLVFDERRDGDLESVFGGLTVLTDAISAGYLRGCTIDYRDELTGGGFKISNPNARQSCGCGKSFGT